MGCSQSSEVKTFIYSQARSNMQKYMVYNMHDSNLRPSAQELKHMTSTVPYKLRKRIQRLTLKEINKAQLRNAVFDSPKVKK